MLRSLIYAAPKPGMSVQEFQDYWVHKHAVEFASKLPGIRKYSVDTFFDWGADPAPSLFAGCAEIWMDSVDDLMVAFQSPEYLKGARADEPNWAAFWMTVSLVTETHTVLAGPPDSRDSTAVKMMVLVKRKEGLDVPAFQAAMRDVQGPKLAALPGVRRCDACLVPDPFYATAETPYDGAAVLWFDDRAAAEAALASDVWTQQVEPGWADCVNPKYRHRMMMQEHWIIGPDPA